MPYDQEAKLSERIDMIRKLLERTPNDTFLVYSLGMELASAGRNEEAAEQFRRCIELDGDYLAAYSEGGKALRAAGRLEEARKLFRAGMELAAKAGNAHMRDFLQQQLEGLA